ncbi:MAG: GrpB family protein [Candidatus Parabeggiatoa sp. nov. 1]|nr:MAG: GrpB family protein [Gammaproteobacteria bacterium]HEC85849.1 GrpB family protein [Thioploca sp.]
MRIIEVVEYNPLWTELYNKEAEKIRSLLGTILIRVHHMGSTAIPKMAAKPIIDILLEVKDVKALDGYEKRFEYLGYEPKGEFGIEGRRFYQKGGEQRLHHIHAFNTGHPEVQRHLRFRDYLASHPKQAKDYEQLKRQLASIYPTSPENYSTGKAAFIRQIDNEAIR